MRLQPTSFALPLLALAQASAAVPTYPQPGNSTIQWGPCDPSIESPELPIDCANFTVPLDYSDPSAPAGVRLELLRVKAVTNGTSKGTMFMNFGGPGNEARRNLAGGASQFMLYTGGEYDIIGIDPRGTANTLTMTCYNKTEADEASWKYATFSNTSDAALGEIWVQSKLLAETCFERKKEIGEYVGTAYTARDMMAVVDALNEDGMLRYWGISYGTALGATVAAMFPDRMDKVLLDGVLNSHEYYNSYELEWLSTSDLSFSGFFTGCAAAPENCAIAREGVSGEELEAEFWDFLYHLKFNPFATGEWVANYDGIKNLVVANMYAPAGWPQMAAVLADVYNGNATSLGKFVDAVTTGVYETSTLHAGPAIKCSDKKLRTETLEEYMPNVQDKYDMTDIYGDVYIAFDTNCAQWKFQAKEIYDGDFQVKTKNPVLFAGNTFDPLTPLVSAKNMSSGFEGSAVLQHNGYGHGIAAQHSACTIKAVQQFFADGSLPDPDTVCEPDIPLFSNKTLEDVIELLG